MDLNTLLFGIESLPNNINPYQFLVSKLTLLVAPDVPDAFITIIYLQIGLAAVGACLGIAALCAKWRNKTFWIARVRHTHACAVLAPNTSLLLALATTTYFMISLVQCAAILQAFRDKGSVVLFHSVQGAAWLPILAFGLIESWGQASSIVLAQATSSHNTAILYRSCSIHQVLALVTNLLYPMTFFLSVLPILIIFGILATYARRTDITLKAIEQSLQSYSNGWFVGQTFAAPAQFPALAAVYADDLRSMEVWISRGFQSLFVLGVSITLSLAVTSYFYLRLLSSRLRQARSAIWQDNQPSLAVYEHEGTYYVLLVESMSILSLFGAFMACAGFVAWDARLIFADGHALAAILSTVLFISALVAIPLNLVLLLRNVSPLHSESQASSNLLKPSTTDSSTPSTINMSMTEVV